MNCVYKLTPVSQYDAAGLESWLSDMARRGLYLKKFRPLFCTFFKGEPKQTRYRVEPHKRVLDDDLPRSMLELYQDFGWDYVDEINRSMLLFSTQDPDATELHTDPELQWAQWNKLRRSVTVSCLGNLAVFLFVLGLVLWLLLGSGQPISTLVTSNIPLLVLYLLLDLAILPASFADARQLSLIARQLKEGIPLTHRTLYPRRRPTAVLSFAVAMVLFAVLIAFQWILPLTGNSLRPIGDLDDFEPLALAALESEGSDPAHYALPGTDYGNFCRLDRDLLCWNQWWVVQTGALGADDRWVRLEIMWYDLPGSLLAKPLAREQLEQAMVLDDHIWWALDEPCGWTVNDYCVEGTDFFAVAHSADNTFQAAAVAAGDKAAVIRYTGHGELAEHLLEIAAMLAVS